MIKAWTGMWKNIFNYKGHTKRKAYWLGIFANLISMYVLVIPYSLVMKSFSISAPVMIAVYLIAINLPVLSMYFRRANDVGFRIGTTIFIALVAPVISGFLVGILPTNTTVDKTRSLVGKIFAVCVGMFLYGSLLGIVLYDDPTAISFLPITGLLLASFTLIVYGVINWRDVVAFFGVDVINK